MLEKRKSLEKQTRKVNKKLLDLAVVTGTTLVRADEDDGWKKAIEQMAPIYVDLLKESLELQMAYAKKLDRLEERLIMTQHMIRKNSEEKE